MPNDVFRRLEKVRRARKLTRSAAIQGAVDRWLRDYEQERAAKEYAEGYRRVPEDPREAEAWVGSEVWGIYEGD